MRRSVVAAVLIVAAAAVVGSPALAKSARCFTSDDGYFDCEFYTTADDGSFEVMQADGTGFGLTMDKPGFAYGYLIEGNDNTNLPGEYVRSRDDGACWNNPETDDKKCAW
jgi:hypothetical protein